MQLMGGANSLMISMGQKPHCVVKVAGLGIWVQLSTTGQLTSELCSATPAASPSPTAPASGELLCRLRYPRRVRVGHHGDQVRHRSDGPDQANRDHDADYPCKHWHPLYVALSLPIGVHSECEVVHRRPRFFEAVRIGSRISGDDGGEPLARAGGCAGRRVPLPFSPETPPP